MHTMHYTLIPSPLGTLLLAGRDGNLERLEFCDAQARRPPPEWVRCDGAFAPVAVQLGEYFAGRRRRFDVPLRPTGTPFQLAVLEALRTIPYGETKSYGDIARQIGRPRAVRAVGMANGRNPLPIVIPCHRVIGADGSLTGFGGGLKAKRHLLALEGAAAWKRANGSL